MRETDNAKIIVFGDKKTRYDIPLSKSKYVDGLKKTRYVTAHKVDKPYGARDRREVRS